MQAINGRVQCGMMLMVIQAPLFIINNVYSLLALVPIHKRYGPVVAVTIKTLGATILFKMMIALSTRMQVVKLMKFAI